MSYLFGFKGRINRAKIWLFLLICFAVDIALIVIAANGFDWSETGKTLIAAMKELTPGEQLDIHNVAAPRMTGSSHTALAAIGVLYLLFVWAALAVYTKRLHDRGKSAWWLVLYWLVPFVLQAYGYWSAPSIADAIMGQRTVLGHAAFGIASLISLWVFIELFFFRGTNGENKYGPDPLAK